MQVSPASVRAARVYEHLLKELGNEFYLLLDAPLSDLETAAGSPIAQAISRLRTGKISWKPGFDGEYGTMELFS